MAKKVTVAQAETALLQCYGNVSAASRALGVAHSTLFGRIKKSERLQRARTLAEEQTLDIAEDKLVAALKNGEDWAVRFILKTKGKKRGYTEKQEFAISEDNPFEVSIMGAIMGQGDTSPHISGVIMGQRTIEKKEN